jgi:hypothetical protein
MPGKALKVFQAHLGFFDTVVAAPSKKAALEAWGSRQDLFHTGLASVAADKGAIAAALAKPGVVLKRPAGSSDPFTAEPRLPTIKTGPKRPPSAKPSPPPPRRAAREPKPPPPDRSELDSAEKALVALKREIGLSEADFARRRKELVSEEQQAKSKFRARERELEQRLATAKDAYSRALRKQGK